MNPSGFGDGTHQDRVLALFAHDPERSSSPGVKGIRRALIRALTSYGVTPLLIDDSWLASSFDPAKADIAPSVVVFAEGRSALKSAQTHLAGYADVAFFHIIVPTSYPQWGTFSDHWTKEFIHDSARPVTYITDSPLSRSVIEEHLSHYRAQAIIIRPSWGDVDSAESRGDTPDDLDFRGTKEALTRPQLSLWSFGAAKVESHGRQLGTVGSAWSFDSRTPDEVESQNPPNVSEADESRAHNRDAVGAMIRPRRFQVQSPRVGVLGTKLDFIEELSRDISLETGSPVTLDEWPHLSGPPNKERAQRILNQSDVVIGEWARPNNFWIQENAPARTKLIVRAHRYEVTTPFPHKIDMDRYDAAVCIVPWVGRVLVQKYGWPAEKMVYIPNYVNRRYFSRPKLPGSEFSLGIVGITPDLKRIDLALDLLERLRQVDTRYTLSVRSTLPPQHIHWESNAAISQQWGSVQHRLRVDPLLRNAVRFDPLGRDMARWLEGIGNILSLSDLEGSHVALAEGIASGALPVARKWPGITTLWPKEIVKETLDEAVDWILKGRSQEWREATTRRLSGHPSLDQDRVLDTWWALINGELEEAQGYFGPIDWTALTHEPVVL